PYPLLLAPDGVRVHPHRLVQLLDRIRRREVPVRPPDDDRLARGDLPLDLRDDQPEPRRRQAPSDRRSAVADRQGGGQAERGATQPLQSDPRADEGDPLFHQPAIRPDPKGRPLKRTPLARFTSPIRADPDAHTWTLSRSSLEDEAGGRAECERAGGADGDHSLGGRALDQANFQRHPTDVSRRAEFGHGVHDPGRAVTGAKPMTTAT